MSQRNIGNWYKEANPKLMLHAHMSKERAQFVLNNCHVLKDGSKVGFKYAFQHEWVRDHSPLYPEGITELEDCYIKMVWNLVGNRASYYDVVKMIAKGEV